MIHIPVAILLAAVLVVLALAGYTVAVVRKLRTVTNRLFVLGTLLAPAKSGKKNPEMRLVLARQYLHALITWLK